MLFFRFNAVLSDLTPDPMRRLVDGRRSIGGDWLELTADDATRMCHRMHVHIDIAVAGLFEDRCQGRSAGSVDDVGVGNRRVAYPLAVNVPPRYVEARKEDDDRAIDAGRTTVEMRLGDAHAAFDTERIFTLRLVLVDQDLESSCRVRCDRGYLLIARQPSLKRLIRRCDGGEGESREGLYQWQRPVCS